MKDDYEEGLMDGYDGLAPFMEEEYEGLSYEQYLLGYESAYNSNNEYDWVDGYEDEFDLIDSDYEDVGTRYWA